MAYPFFIEYNFYNVYFNGMKLKIFKYIWFVISISILIYGIGRIIKAADMPVSSGLGALPFTIEGILYVIISVLSLNILLIYHFRKKNSKE